MAAPPSAYKDRHFLAIIGDEVCYLLNITISILTYAVKDSVTGLLLAGIGVGARNLPTRLYTLIDCQS